MRVIINGSRTYVEQPGDFNTLDNLHAHYKFTTVLSGRAPGADMMGERWARSRGIPVEEYPADWCKYGKSAGPRRNQQMVNAADMLVAFPGGTGTHGTVAMAEDAGLIIARVGWV